MNTKKQMQRFEAQERLRIRFENFLRARQMCSVQGCENELGWYRGRITAWLKAKRISLATGDGMALESLYKKYGW